MTSSYPPYIPLKRVTNYDSPKVHLKRMNSKRQDAPFLEQPRIPRGVNSLIVLALLLVVASTFFTLWVTTTKKACPLGPLLTYSPVNEAIQYVEKRFDAAANSTSVYRGDPSPEVDAAWLRISTGVKDTRLNREQFLMSGGNDTAAAVKYRPEDGGGYLSQIDGYHHLHCLDMLRKNLRRDYYAADSFFSSMLRIHLGHCIEIIRQKLMCTSDLTMVTYDWVPGFDNPRPNLNAVHLCVDFEQILDWSDKHDAHVSNSRVIRFGDEEDLPGEPT